MHAVEEIEFSPKEEDEKMTVMMMIHTFIPLACAECDDSLPFSGTSSIPLCYLPFLSTLFH
jgi:hypothetical protein